MQTTEVNPVLYVIRPVAGGMREHLLTLAKNLDPRRFTPLAIVATDDLLATRLREQGIEPRIDGGVGSLNPLTIMKTALKISRVARSKRVSIVHSHGYRASLVGGIGALLAGVPHITTVHTEIGGKRDAGRLDRLIQRAVSFLSTRVIVVSKAIDGSFDAEKVRLIENGIDLDSSKEAIGDSLPVKEDGERRVGIVARLSPEKGVDLFLKAASIISKQNDDVKFYIVGEGPLRGELEKEAQDLRVYERTTFTGFVEGARSVLGSFDVLVLPSRSEGQPMVLLEALAAGCPVVATDVGGVREVLEGGCGIVIPSGDPVEIASAVDRLLSEADRRAEIVCLGKRRVEERFSAVLMAAKTMDVYEEALS